MGTSTVPNLVGLTRTDAEAALQKAGLALGAVTIVSSSTAPTGSVSNADPAAGVPVSQGSKVNLQISSGLAPVAVPDVVGLTRSAAQEKLKSVGLMVGAVKTHDSNLVPLGGVSDMEPEADTLVSPGTKVDLDLSNGPKSNWTQNIPTYLLGALGVCIFVLMIYVISEDGQKFLSSLADRDRARGLITFLIAFATVGIAIILAISTLILAPGDDGDKRFDRGKQVLSVLIGVLGTIVGFYYGAETKPKEGPTAGQTQTSTHISTPNLPDGTVNQPYASTTLQTTGLIPPLKWSVDPKLPDGLGLNSATGIISGTPKATKSKTLFTFTVTDSATPPITDHKELGLEIK